jgi:hypothetical protein
MTHECSMLMKAAPSEDAKNLAGSEPMLHETIIVQQIVEC